MGPKFSGAPLCPRCSKAVYMAEQITGPGGMWHKNCLTCKECNKRLDSTTLTERNNEAYCKTCYGKLFGPKGYGYGGGGGVLSTDATITPEQRFPSTSSCEENLYSPSRDSSVVSVEPAASSSLTSPITSTATMAVSPSAIAASRPKFTVPVSGNCPRCNKQVYFAPWWDKVS